MAMKGVSVSIDVRLRPTAAFEIANAMLAGLIEFAQEVVAHAARNHPYKDRTGTNSRSIGWGAHERGRSWGALTAGRGSTSSSGAPTADADKPEVIVATTSGYGGYLETGTVHMPPYPHIIPAIMAKKDVLRQKLTRVL